jgi:hypothetical protein
VTIERFKDGYAARTNTNYRRGHVLQRTSQRRFSLHLAGGDHIDADEPS